MLKRRLKEPFGKAGLTVAILALVMALVGGAYAAGGLTKSQEKQVTKIAKKYAGKPGAAGANGTSGSPGAKGDAGAAGANGTSGTSATTKTFSGAKGACTSGGVEVSSASPTVNVCNGEPGVIHPGETLAPGATETGSWSLGSTNETHIPNVGVLHLLFVPVSFPIPLAAPLSKEHGCGETGEPECQVHYINNLGEEVLGQEVVVIGEPGEEEVEFTPIIGPGTECPGSAANPIAEPGNLCVYAGSLEEHAASYTILNPATGFAGGGAATAGATLAFAITQKNLSAAMGTWAVTEAE